jgi:hypothetical protein
MRSLTRSKYSHWVLTPKTAQISLCQILSAYFPQLAEFRSHATLHRFLLENVQPRTSPANMKYLSRDTQQVCLKNEPERRQRIWRSANDGMAQPSGTENS